MNVNHDPYGYHPAMRYVEFALYARMRYKTVYFTGSYIRRWYVFINVCATFTLFIAVKYY